MPLPTVIAMGKKAGKSKDEIEKLWKQAKQIAKEELGLKSDNDLEKQSSRGYKYSMGIFKKMIGINESLIKEQGYKYKVSVPERQADQFRMKIEKYLNWDEYGESKSNGKVIFSFTEDNYKQIETFVKQYSNDIKVKEKKFKENYNYSYNERSSILATYLKNKFYKREVITQNEIYSWIENFQLDISELLLNIHYRNSDKVLQAIINNKKLRIKFNIKEKEKTDIPLEKFNKKAYTYIEKKTKSKIDQINIRNLLLVPNTLGEIVYESNVKQVILSNEHNYVMSYIYFYHRSHGNNGGYWLDTTAKESWEDITGETLIYDNKTKKVIAENIIKSFLQSPLNAKQYLEEKILNKE